jgi:hypothetical protein
MSMIFMVKYLYKNLEYGTKLLLRFYYIVFTDNGRYQLANGVRDYVLKKLKVKLSLPMPQRHVRREEVQHHSFLILALEAGEWSISCPTCLTPRKESQYPLSRRLGGPQSRSGCFTDEKNFLPLPGFKNWTVEPTAYSL